MPMAVIDPHSVRRPVIIADVNVRGAIAVEVPKRGGEPPIPGRFRQRKALFIKKGTVGPTNRREPPLAIVKQELVGLAVFVKTALQDHQAVLEMWRDHQLPLAHADIYLPSIPDVAGAVICDIQVKRAIAVDVGQSHGNAAIGTGCAGRRGMVDKAAVAVIHVANDALTDGGDEQIEPTVAVEVGKHRPAIELPGRSNPDWRVTFVKRNSPRFL